jgi:hypothetical protein
VKGGCSRRALGGRSSASHTVACASGVVRLITPLECLSALLTASLADLIDRGGLMPLLLPCQSSTGFCRTQVAC